MRLDQQKQIELQPVRLEYAKNRLTELGHIITYESKTELRFEHKGYIVFLYPYTGWFQGKSVFPGRGIDKLLNQIS